MSDWEQLSGKIRLKPGMKVLLLNLPGHIVPEGNQQEFFHTLPAGQVCDAGLLFVNDSAALQSQGPAFIGSVVADGLVWIAYPKKSSPLHTDLHRDEGWQVIYRMGLRPVSQIAVDNDWSAVRFRPGVLPDMSRKPRQEIIIPADLLQALEEAGLTGRFASLAYTHRKEYVNWITEAKKEETRLRRIAKAVEMVAAGINRS